MGKYVYQDPVTKEKFVHDKKVERSNPINNVRLIYLGEEGSGSANEGIDVITIAKLTDLITRAESSAQLKSIMEMEIPKALVADKNAEKALSDLCQKQMELLHAREHNKEQEELEKFRKRQQQIADDITKKIYAAQSRKDLQLVYTPGQAVEGLSSDFAAKLTQLYQKRWDELGGV